MPNILTRKIWEFVQIFPPLPADFDDLFLIRFSLRRESLIISMFYHFADIIGIHSIKDCEKILAVRESVLCVFILEKLIDLGIVFELWI